MTEVACNRMLIAGIGNIFLGDDAFGSEVARKLAARAWPVGVRVVDFGIHSIDLVYALVDGYDVVVIVDATQRGGSPGTVYLVEPELPVVHNESPTSPVNGHALDPLRVLQTAISLGGSWQQLFLVGCEPADLGGDEGCLGLSAVVQSAIETACEMVEDLVERFAGQLQ